MSFSLRLLFINIFAVATLGACITTPPKVPAPPTIKAGRNGETVTRYVDPRIPYGYLTVSTPKVTPLRDRPAGPNSLDYGTLKSMDKLMEAVRRSSIQSDESFFHQIQFQLALKLAATQLYSNKTTELSGTGGGATTDLAALVDALSKSDPAAVAGLLEGSGEINVSKSASYQETFKSPDLPALPALPTPNETLRAKLLSLLDRSTTQGLFLDPAREIKLAAELHSNMVNLEAFNNFDGLFDIQALGGHGASADGDFWAPYRVQFIVTVEPGWYSFLSQHDAVFEIHFGQSPCATPLRNIPKEDVRILAVFPGETSQQVDRFLSGLDSLQSAFSLAAPLKVAAIQTELKTLQDSAKRLQGLRANTQVVVGFPSDSAVRVRVRPSIVAEQHLAETQPQQILLTAYALIRQPDPPDEERLSSRKNALIEEMVRQHINDTEAPVGDSSTFRATIKPIPDASRAEIVTLADSNDAGGGLHLTRALNAQFDGFYQPSVQLRPKSRLNETRAFYQAPRSQERDIKYQVAHDETRAALVPPFPYRAFKPFGFAVDPFGYYDTDGNNVTTYIAVAVSNPSQNGVKPEVSFYLDGIALPDANTSLTSENLGSAAVSGVLRNGFKVSQFEKGADGKSGFSTTGPVRVMVEVERKDPTTIQLERDVRAVILYPRIAPAPAAASSGGDKSKDGGAPTINIDTSGVKVNKLPPNTLSPQDALLLNQSLMLFHTMKKDSDKPASPTTPTDSNTPPAPTTPPSTTTADGTTP